MIAAVLFLREHGLDARHAPATLDPHLRVGVQGIQAWMYVRWAQIVTRTIVELLTVVKV